MRMLKYKGLVRSPHRRADLNLLSLGILDPERCLLSALRGKARPTPKCWPHTWEGSAYQSPQPGRVGRAPPHLRRVSQFRGLNSSAAIQFGALNFIFRTVSDIPIQETCYLYLNVSLRTQRIQPSSLQIILFQRKPPSGYLR